MVTVILLISFNEVSVYSTTKWQVSEHYARDIRQGGLPSVFKHANGLLDAYMQVGSDNNDVSFAADTVSVTHNVPLCSAPVSSEQVLNATEFKWFYTKIEMAEKFNEVYSSGKRLLNRARRSGESGEYELLYEGNEGTVEVPITRKFIENLTAAIVKAHKLAYVDHVFFPDMGHSHLWIPKQLFDEFTFPMSDEEIARLYTQSLNHPDTRFLFHTAEQLKMLDDEHYVLSDKALAWRYFTRNLLVANDNSNTLDILSNLESIGNTVCEPAEGYALWSAGLYISASEDGCFSYTIGNQTRYYDISLTNLPTPVNDLVPLVSDDEQSEIPLPALLWGEHACKP